jgi:hypothetical protein
MEYFWLDLKPNDGKDDKAGCIEISEDIAICAFAATASG